MFGTDNSIEPGRNGAAVGGSPDNRATPRMVMDKASVREATPVDLAAAARRARSSAVPDPSPVQAVAEARGSFFRRRPVEPVQPDAVARQHGLYMTEKRSTRRYYADYQQKREVMRAEPKRITTKLDDKQTVSAMLDLAQSRGWETVRLRGTPDFQREAWVQAQLRGMTAEGYKPTATDRQEAARRKVAAAPAEAVPVQAAAPKPTAATAPRASVQVTNSAKSAAPTEKQAAPAEVAVSGQPRRAAATKRMAAAPAQETAATADSQAIPIQRGKAVWGAVEVTGQQARAADAATAKATAGERPTAAATA